MENNYQDQVKKILMGITSIGLFGISFLILIASLGSSTPTSDLNASSNGSDTGKQVVSAEERENAKKDLEEVINLAKTAKLVTSYEFSEKASVVYVDSAWYGQKVQFKKDFLAKIATLKELITGYRHFVARDAYSNEKVAEVTAFSGSLEVYK